jgi:ATP-dependent Lhr-like helicase
MDQSAASILSAPLKRRLAESGIQHLNVLQEQAIPIIHSGADALLIAPTAGGKTEAAILPLLERAASSEGGGVKLLYVAPLRALLNDIAPRISRYASALGLRAEKWHGDVSATDKHRMEKSPPDVLLITPESIEVILVGRRSLDTLFPAPQAILVDEVHYFCASARGAQLISEVARIEAIAECSLQRVGLSATVGNPEFVLEWLARPNGRRELISLAPDRASDLKKRLWEVLVSYDNEIARNLLPKIAKPHPSGTSDSRTAPRSIIFCRSRRGTEDMSRQVEQELKWHKGVRFSCAVHHSSVGKDWRERAEAEIKLRDAKSRSIFATSSLELGIDLGDLDLVGEAGPMSTVSSFLQRVGRAGRRLGKPQWFVSVNVYPSPDQQDDDLVSRSWSFLKNLAILNLGARGIVEDVEPVPKAYHVLCQQILAACVANHGLDPKRDLPTITRCSAFADISDGEIAVILRYMVDEDYLREVPPLLVAGGQTEKRYLYNNALPLFSVFDSPPDFTVMDGKSEVGMVDARYVIGLEVPFDLRLAGRYWRAEAVSVEHAIVRVTPAQAGKPPHWFSSSPGTSRIVAEEMAAILHGAPLADVIELHEAAEAWLDEVRRVLQVPVREKGVIEVERFEDALYNVSAQAGDRVMRTLAMWLESTLPCSCKVLSEFSLSLSPRPETSALILAASVAAVFRRLKSTSDLDAVALTAENVSPDVYNKFAACVPPDLRRLHLASSLTDFVATRAFEVVLK